jgi:ABC-2 type transport system ATP-binding protein
MLSGILYPTKGKISLMGYDPWERNPKMQKKFAIVMGQKSQLWWDLPPLESFLLYKEIYEISKTRFEKNLKELSRMLNVEDVLKIQTRKLSLGQRMKCEIIAALLHSPKVLFLDEPTIGLDVVSQKAIRSFIRKYNNENNITVILTSHYMDDIEKLCKRVIIIDKGSIIFDGKLKRLMADYVNSKILKITFTEPVSKKSFLIFKKAKIISFMPYRTELKVDNKDYKNIAKDILGKFPVDDLLIDEISIETVIHNIFSFNNSK